MNKRRRRESESVAPLGERVREGAIHAVTVLASDTGCTTTFDPPIPVKAGDNVLAVLAAALRQRQSSEGAN
jgi:hypothetical protein